MKSPTSPIYLQAENGSTATIMLKHHTKHARTSKSMACCEVMLKSCKGVSIILHHPFHSTPAFRKLKRMYKTMSTSRAGKMKQGKHVPALHARDLQSAILRKPMITLDEMSCTCANDCFYRAQGGRNHPWYLITACRAAPDACFYASTGRLDSSLVWYLSCSICRVAIIC